MPNSAMARVHQYWQSIKPQQQLRCSERLAKKRKKKYEQANGDKMKHMLSSCIVTAECIQRSIFGRRPWIPQLSMLNACKSAKRVATLPCAYNLCPSTCSTVQLYIYIYTYIQLKVTQSGTWSNSPTSELSQDQSIA